MNPPILNPLQNPFDFANHHVRTAVDELGNVWFCAKDVFEALDLVWKGRRASLENCPEKWLMVWYLQTSYGEKETIFMSEPAVYQTTFRSNKPEAMKFIEWVCEEVLPSIRKTGSYGKAIVSDYLPRLKMVHEIINELQTCRNQLKREVLIDSLYTLCNSIGKKVPSLEKLALRVDQKDLFEGGVQ